MAPRKASIGRTPTCAYCYSSISKRSNAWAAAEPACLCFPPRRSWDFQPHDSTLGGGGIMGYLRAIPPSLLPLPWLALGKYRVPLLCVFWAASHQEAYSDHRFRAWGDGIVFPLGFGYSVSFGKLIFLNWVSLSLIGIGFGLINKFMVILGRIINGERGVAIAQ